MPSSPGQNSGEMRIFASCSPAFSTKPIKCNSPFLSMYSHILQIQRFAEGDNV